MKILKIFGLVVGIHVTAFMIVFAIPGCRSMSRHSPPPPAAVQAERAPVRPAAAYVQNDTVSPVGVSSSAPAFAPAPNPPAASSAPLVSFPLSPSSSSAVRANPTRPGSPTANGLRAAPTPETTPATTYVVVAGDNLSKVAKKFNLTGKELAAANNLRSEAPLRLGQKLIIPGKATPVSSPGSQPSGPTGDTLVYKVKAGDSLAIIAKRAGTTPAAIKSLNHLKTDAVRAGQELTLPAGASAAATLAAAPAEPEAPAGAIKSADGSIHHVVKHGENLGIIARHYGVKSSEIAVANNIADPLKIRVGQDLVIPLGKTTGSARSTTPPRPAPQPPMAEPTPATPPSSPFSAPVDPSPIAPSPTSTPASNPTVPPTIDVQETNPIAAPKQP